ncbi:MAG TPA: glycosyltransferase family 4 protein, partial [Patescibacteria group bacterium]|nr:glycosyltransferase family 4 protein [Patescibacteria group bacterium]
DDKQEFVKRGLLNEEKCILISGSGVNLEKYTPVLLPNAPVFLMIGRILRDKGIMEYIKAAREIKKKYPYVKFQLLGPFDVNPQSLKYNDIEPYISDGSVEYLGQTNDVRPFIQKCSTFVLPSYREGTPRSTLEAMAMGRPIITTDAPGCRETVIDGVNGFLVPIKNINVLIEKMIWMIENREAAANMGQASLHICEAKYDVKKVNEDIMNAMGL